MTRKTCETCSDFNAHFDGHLCGNPMTSSFDSEIPWMTINNETPACGFYFQPQVPATVDHELGN